MRGQNSTVQFTLNKKFYNENPLVLPLDGSISIHSIADKSSRYQSWRHNFKQASADKDTESPDSSVSSLSDRSDRQRTAFFFQKFRTESGQNVENIFWSQLIG